MQQMLERWAVSPRTSPWPSRASAASRRRGQTVAVRFPTQQEFRRLRGLSKCSAHPCAASPCCPPAPARSRRPSSTRASWASIGLNRVAEPLSGRKTIRPSPVCSANDHVDGDRVAERHGVPQRTKQAITSCRQRCASPTHRAAPTRTLASRRRPLLWRNLARCA